MSTFDIDTAWPAGKKIRDYTMLEEAHEGADAFIRSYWGRAKSPTGQVVFFKKYYSPSSSYDDWYQGYVDYQSEIKKRINSISATDAKGRNSGPTYRFIEFFEEVSDDGSGDKDYFQVLEFIDGAKDLKTYLTSADTTWNDRKKFASLFMYAMNELHTKCEIIHTDLKPQNLLLIPVVNSNGVHTYQLKIIDLDAAIIKNMPAPWLEAEGGYLGTEGYLSPEHQNGTTPTEKSDIFTCGLILYEILAKGGHPYAGEDGVYKPYEAYPAPLPQLIETYGSPESDAQIAEMLQRMLDPDPAKRPTAEEVRMMLVHSGSRRPAESARRAEPARRVEPARPAAEPARPAAEPARPAAEPARRVEPARPAAEPAPAVRTYAFCKLKSASSNSAARVFPNSKIGYRFLEILDPEAKKYYSSEHFMITFQNGKWFIKHCASAKNKTAVNKVLVNGEVELHNGDIIEAASSNGSVTVMPFTVEIGG